MAPVLDPDEALGYEGDSGQHGGNKCEWQPPIFLGGVICVLWGDGLCADFEGGLGHCGRVAGRQLLGERGQVCCEGRLAECFGRVAAGRVRIASCRTGRCSLERDASCGEGVLIGLFGRINQTH